MKRSILGRGREFDRIRTLLARANAEVAERGDVPVGPGDDCAMVVGHGIVLSSDLSVEGVHFRRSWLSDEEIGYRAAAAALSDLAAVAARPIGILVSLALPPDEDDDLLLGIGDGIRDACRLTGAALLGGDLSRSGGGLVLDVVAAGESARPILRSGAVAGDELWVTGYLGGSAAAVRAWEAGETPSEEARAAFARPVPRTREALWLAEKGEIRALIDLSDGLAGDAGHLAAASGVDMVIEGERLPIHSAAREAGERAPAQGRDAAAALELALRGGEDYELCFSAPEGATEGLCGTFEENFGLRLTRVGRVLAPSARRGEEATIQGDPPDRAGEQRGHRTEEGGRVLLEWPTGEIHPLSEGGYDHFRKGDDRT